MSGLTPRPYQIAGRDFLAARTRALLGDEMRVGKTPQAILAAEKVGAKKALVVCPAIAVPHWHREWRKWWPGEVLPKIEVLSYDRAKINAAGLVTDSRDVLIIDECHFAKNPDVQRTKLVYGKNGLGYGSRYIWALSGTPAPKHAGELWPMLRAFGVVGMTYDEFIRRYCYFRPMESKPLGTRKDRIPELRVLLSKIMLRRKRKDVAPDMPEIDFQFLEVEPYVVPADMKVPVGLSDEQMLAWLEANSATNKEDRVAVAQAKAAPLADEIEFAVTNGLLKQFTVFGWHIEPLETLCDLLRRRGVSTGLINGKTSTTDREKIQAEFRAGSLDGVVANILTAGTAIDLSAASHGYFLELDWVPGNNVQAASRMVSMDKKEPVTMDVVTWPGSADDRVQSVLMRRVRELSQLM